MKKEKLELKYLVSGTVEVDIPDGWKKMNDKEKQYYVDNKMSEFCDADLLEGLKEVPADKWNETWEELPDVCAIIDPTDEENEYSMLSKTWYGFAYGSCKPGLLVQNANRLVCVDDLFRDY